MPDKMTPVEIEVLLHCCYRSDHLPGTIAVEKALERLKKNYFIDQDNKMTDRGNAHVKQLCNLSWPVKMWVSPLNNRTSRMRT